MNDEYRVGSCWLFMVVPMMLVVRYGDGVVGGIAFIDEWGLANVG